MVATPTRPTHQQDRTGVPCLGVDLRVVLWPWDALVSLGGGIRCDTVTQRGGYLMRAATKHVELVVE